MTSLKTIKALENFGRTRLSKSFYMRDFLHSEIANLHEIQNIPDNPSLAIKAGTKLCEELLQPLNDVFGGISIRSAYRSCRVNEYGNKHGFNCSRNETNYANHIWDRLDANGKMGATACIVIPWFTDRYENGADWRSLAWWMHDHLPYSQIYFHPMLAAFNITWHEVPKRRINSYIKPRGYLTKPGMDNHIGSHAEFYQDFPTP